MSFTTIQRVEALDLAAGARQMLRASVKASAEAEEKSGPLAGFQLFSLLSPELRARIVEVYLDDFARARGRKVQTLREEGGNSLRLLPETAHVNRELRHETSRRFLVATIVKSDNRTGEKILGTTVMDRTGDVLLLEGQFADGVPVWARVLLKNARNIITGMGNVLPTKKRFAGPAISRIVGSKICTNLEQVEVVARVTTKEFIEVSMANDQLLAFADHYLRQIPSLDVYGEQEYANLHDGSVVTLQHIGREFYIALDDDEALGLLISILTAARGSVVGSIALANDHDVQGALKFRKASDVRTWEKYSPIIKKQMGKEIGPDSVPEMRGTIKVTIANNGADNAKHIFAPAGLMPLEYE